VTVYLVGAGPGDAGLLTLRGADLLGRADAVVHDRLVHHKMLATVPPTAELHDVGKRPGERASQADINELLVGLAKRFQHGVVVRLKGGDPYIFGRGGEEALALQVEGLAFEVVPGVSAPNGVLAYAGIPLTHRGVSAGFTVVTGHGSDGTVSGGPVPVDWDALARLGGTIVILMGVEHRAEIAERLVSGGLKPSTPVAIIENGTLANQRTTKTTLGGLGATDAGAPATIVVGDVVSIDLSWFATRPLFGWTVAITRTRGQASVLGAALSEAGATTIEVPTIEIAEPADGAVALAAGLEGLRNHSYRWVVFTSQNAVDSVFNHVRDARAFADTNVASVGDATASALRARGVVADLVPGRFSGAALAAAFPVATAQGERVLLPRAAEAGDELPATLRAKGYEVDVVEAYRNIRPRLEPAAAEAVRGADAVTFASSSSVTGFLELLGRDNLPPVVACIGPVTAGAARAAGIEVAVEAADASVAGLVRGLEAYAAATRVAAKPDRL
jgi:uroporphyrinogen III methyltransferase/synthase